ncbi:MAG: hypothetical protein ABI193_19710 [Minicystis sp.]
MARAAPRGSPVELKASPLTSIERSLDRTIEHLVDRAPAPESRALLIEAKRLRSVVANWRSLAPNDAVYQDMIQRTLALSVSSGASLYDPAHDLRAEIDPFVMTEETSLVDLADDPEAYLVDFEPHLYSLAVLAPPGRSGRVSVPTTPWSVAAAKGAPREEARTPPHAEPMYEAPEPRRAEPLREPYEARRVEPVRELHEVREARRSEPAPPLLRVVRTPVEDRPSSHPPARPPRSYPPEVFDEGPEQGAQLSEEHELSYPRVPQFAPPSMGGGREGELVYPSLPPIERGTTGMLRPMPLPSFPGTSIPGNTPTGRNAPSDEAYFTPERPRTLRPPMPELSLDEARSPSDAPMAPQTSVDVVVLKKPENVDPNIVMISDPYGDRADAFRALRRKLASSGNPHVILVTSAGEGDGKTTTAINLAISFREGIRGKVLLIEGNLRAPGVAKALNFEPPLCFDAQIKSHQEDPLAPWVAAELLPQFHVMAVDPTKEHEPIFDPIAFAAGMTRLRGAGYEFIVIDSPPAIGSVDVRMIADLVDGTLFTAIRLKSKRAALREAMELIQPSPMLGVVMMDA